MSEPRKQIPELDRLIHEPARLAILTVLNSCRSADFLFLLRVTGLSKGNLSVQLTRLEEAGLIRIEKCFVRKKTRTTVSLSRHGSEELARYWETVDRLRSFSGGSDDRSRDENGSFALHK